MRIKKISIEKYKNLVNFEREFSDSNISAFIGNNGSGKSNLLEVITEVFSYAKKHCEEKRYKIIVPPEIHDCNIEYEMDGVFYVLKYSHPTVDLYCNEKKLSKSEMNAALPENIMLYYAGETQRQARTAAETFDEKYDNRLKRADINSFPGYKYIDYYSVDDLGLLLLTAAVYKGEYYEKLLHLLKCETILPKINIMLQNPKGKEQEDADTYWGARGFVQSFLDALRRYVSSTQNLLLYYSMSFADIEPFRNTAEDESDFFAKLKAIKNAGYLHWIKLELRKHDGEEFSFDMLSEGEKQLSLLYLLTTFTAKDNCLYLFDEFDSYLHPNWQRAFAELIRNISVSGHLLFTTHSPLTLTKLDKEEITILIDGDVYEPTRDTYNRDVSDILTELMDVSRRPAAVENLIKKFKQASYFGKKEKALLYYAQLKEILSEDDPFLLQAGALVEEL